MARKREKWPPKVSAKEAVRIVTSIHSSYGKSVNLDLVAPILRCSRKSSNFSKRLSALAEFGLVTYGRDVVSLTSLAQVIAAPVSGAERAKAIMDAFKNMELLAALLSRFPGGHLPSKQNVENLLIREYSIPRETVGGWADFVEESFAVLPEMDGNQDPARPEIPAPAPTDSEGKQGIRGAAEGTIEIRLKRGENRAIFIPGDFNQEELDWFIKWFAVWQDRPE